jgi:hypothetical protein
MIRWDEWRGSLDGRPTFWSKTLLRVGSWRLDLHKFIAGDDAGCFHTHPAHALRVILFGGYVEEVERVGAPHLRSWRPGMIGLIPPSLSHRVVSLRNGRVSYSLWIRGPKVARIELRGDGWANQRSANA